MKKIGLLLLLPLLLNSCAKELISLVDLPYTLQFEIQPGLSPFDTWELNIPNIPNNKVALFNSRGITDTEVTKIVGKTGILSTVSSSAEFDFIQEISLEIYSDDVNDATEFLYREQVSQNSGEQVGLNGSLPNIMRHLEGETFGILVKIRPRRSADQRITTRLDFTLAVL